MEEKAVLMLQSQRLSAEMDNIQAKADKLTALLAEVPANTKVKIEKMKADAQQAFITRKASDLDGIKALVKKKQEEIERKIDSFPDLDTKEYAGRFEIKALEEHLVEVYPPGMIEDYMCLDPIILDDEGEAYTVYSSAENGVAGLEQGNLVASVFNSLSEILNSASETPDAAIKVSLVFMCAMVGLLVFSPFLFLTAYALLGVGSALHGRHIAKLLRKLYSVKLFLNDAYDEDIFAKNKSDILASTESFLADAQAEAEEFVNSKVFRIDDEAVSLLEREGELEAQRLRVQIELADAEKQKVQQDLRVVMEKLTEIMNAEAEAASKAKDKYLKEITWDTTWLESIFLDVTEENAIKAMPYSKGNSLYFSRDAERLKELSRLIILQSMLHMNPDIASNVVLDYRYNGGSLTQFSSVPTRLCELCYVPEDLTKKEENLTLKIQSRTNNILGSCESIEAYNEIMATYNAPGEYYIVVHVFGIKNLAQQFINNVSNGPRVGVFYKFYCTVEELQELNGLLPLEAMQDFFNITDRAVPQRIMSVRRIMEQD